jgi:rsbT co-antagonist protein RsbR
MYAALCASRSGVFQGCSFCKIAYTFIEQSRLRIAEIDDIQPYQSHTVSSIDDPAAEIERLRRRIVDLEAMLDQQRQDDELTERLRAIIENTPDVISTADTEGRIVYTNRAGRQLFGAPSHASPGERRIPQFHPDWVANLILNEALPHAAREGYWSGETAVRDAQGRETPVAQIIIAHKNAAGDVTHFSTVLRDISENKRIEATLRESEQRLRRFLDALPVGVFVVEPDGRPFYANRSATELLGKGIVPDAVTDQLAEVYRAFVAETDQRYPAERMPLARALRGEASSVDDMEIERPDGRALIEIHGAPIRDAEGRIAYGMVSFTDITMRRRAEEAIRERALQQQVIEAQQAALRELSTPLMPIAEGVVVMPIIGSIDSRRAQQIMETLLEGIAAHSADIAILDITGVRVVDTQVAGALIRAAQAARMLGARVVLSGISAEIAQTLVHIGAEMGEMVALRSLQQGIAYALEQRRSL